MFIKRIAGDYCKKKHCTVGLDKCEQCPRNFGTYVDELGNPYDVVCVRVVPETLLLFIKAWIY